MSNLNTVAGNFYASFMRLLKPIRRAIKSRDTKSRELHASQNSRERASVGQSGESIVELTKLR